MPLVHRITSARALSLGVLVTMSCTGKATQPFPAPQMVFMMPTAAGSVAPGPNDPAWELVVMNLDGSARRQLTHDGKFKFLPHFSPDGTNLVYSRYAVGGYGNPSGAPDIFMYDFASGKETRLTSDANSVQGVWSPDGRLIAYGIDTRGPVPPTVC